MKVWLVGAGPGDPELLTIRGRECLTNADVIIYDALANPALLDCAREGAELIYVGKIAGNHALPQDEINALLVRKAREGKNVVRLKGGDPYIFGRGGEEGMWLYEHGIPFEEVPGISSAIAAPAYAGIPLTDRRAASAVSIITGHESDLNKGTHNWQAYAQSGATLVFVMGMSNLANICRNLIDGGLAESTPAAVVYRGCTPDQKTVAATLGNLPQKVLDAGLANPAVIVVGKAVDLREKLSWFERLPLFGKRIVVTRARAQASGMAHDLAALGAEVIECPVIRVDPLEDYSVLDAAIGKLGDYDWVVFTSANGVDYFFRRLNQAGLDSRALAPCKLAAIGPGTAAALGCRGLAADLVPPRFVAESVAEAMLQAGNLAGKRILLPRASKARDVLPSQLEKHGAVVDVAPAYVTVSANGCGESGLGRVDCISFASSSTVDNFLRLFGAEMLKKEPRPVLAAIGPITARKLEDAGLAADIVPPDYTVPALVAAIMDHFSHKG